MQLLLIRHAHAVDATEDPVRPLSGRGRAQAKAVGRHLRRHVRPTPAEVWHSPLARSRETAEILLDALRWRLTPRVVEGLQPEDDPADTVRRLARRRRSLVIVGHEPHLSGLAGRLLGLDPARAEVEFRKGAALCLEREEPSAPWRIAWLLTPGLAGAKG